MGDNQRRTRIKYQKGFPPESSIDIADSPSLVPEKLSVAELCFEA